MKFERFFFPPWSNERKFLASPRLDREYFHMTINCQIENLTFADHGKQESVLFFAKLIEISQLQRQLEGSKATIQKSAVVKK